MSGSPRRTGWARRTGRRAATWNGGATPRRPRPETQKAIESLNVALKARREAGAGPTDPGLVGNVGDLATVLTETGKPAEALALLDPIIKAQTVKSGPGYSPVDGSPAQGLYRLGQGRAGDRLDEGPRASPAGQPAAPSFTSSWASSWRKSSTPAQAKEIPRP